MSSRLSGPAFIEVNSVRLAVWDAPGNGRTIFFAHATGFHAHCWSRIIEQLPGRRCVALDMRGHGLSEKPSPPYAWPDFAEDVAALARSMNLRDATGVGHSMGGHSLALASFIAPEAFAELILIDPVIMPREAYGSRVAEPHFARKRRNQWASAGEMYERFRDRPPFRDWDAQVLRDYCDYGLLPAMDGNGFVLACPPDVEGAIYDASGLPGADLHDRLAGVGAQVTIVRSARPMRTEAPMDMGASPTDPELASCFQNARDVTTSYSHFIPMEAPDFVAGLIAKG
jgi:pimeloyl-ACP methyl ester carboxylesterase